MTNPTQILTPVGRIVQGDAFQPNTKNAEGNPLVIKNGPNAGQPRVDYFIALAIPKTDPALPELLATIQNEGRSAFPQLFDAAGNCINPKFAFKITDGDSTVPNTKGVAPSSREGYPGHMIFNFSNGFPPKCYTRGGEAVIVDPAQIKRGYWVRISGTVKGNGSSQQPGVFLNLSMIELIAYGEEIFSGPDGATTFGGAPVTGQLPAGASPTPLTPATGLAAAPLAAAPLAVAPLAVAPLAVAPLAVAPLAVAPLAAAPLAAAPLAVAPLAAAPVAAPTVQPAPDFLNPVKKYQTPDGGSWTAEQLTAAGWTPAQIEALSLADVPF